jgi:hypothetical protein
MLGGNARATEEIMLDHWLWELTTVGPYPIPWTLTGQEIIDASDPNIGTVYCWIHEPLAEFPLRACLEHGYADNAIIVADPGRIVDGQVIVAGLGKRFTAIPADRYALGWARRSLQKGIPVICLADAQIGGKLYPFVLQLAERVGARVVFQWAKRRPNGVIDVTFINAPQPYCQDDAAVHENLAFLEAAQKRALEALGIKEQHVTSAATPEQSLPQT